MDSFDQPPPSENMHSGNDVAARRTAEDALNIREIVGKFWSRRWLIAASIITCAALSFITAKLTTPIYTGEALVEIKPVHVGEPATNASVQAVIQGGPEAVPTEAIVLQSRTLAKLTIERLHLDLDPEFAPPDSGTVALPVANGKAVAPAGTVTSAPSDAPGTAVVNAFLGHLKITVEPHSNVIRVSFKSTRPMMAALVPNTLVELYLDRMTSEKNRALAQESERLDAVILPMLRQKMFDSEADRNIYERYVARADDVHGNMGQARPDASLLSAADVPLKPSFPKTQLMVVFGAGLGAGIGVALVVLLDLLRGGLHTAEQVEKTLAIRCLASVPMLSPDDDGRLKGPLSQPQDAAFGQAVRSIQLKLRTSDRRTGSRVILVTSSLPGEGKTWTAVSLAASLAADGFSVALVDCDLHRPSVHRLLDGVRTPGLTDYFAGTAALADICHKTEESGVKYVPVGAAVAKDAWRITANRLVKLSEQLARDYAFVILDSAPMLAISETMLLAQAADKTILVIKWQKTRAAVARYALRQLRESDAETFAILSMVDVKQAAQHGDPAASVYKRLEGYYLQTPRAGTGSSAL